VEVGRLANAVDMFIEWQSVINSHSQTSDASRKLDADALKVESACAQPWQFVGAIISWSSTTEIKAIGFGASAIAMLSKN